MTDMIMLGDLFVHLKHKFYIFPLFFRIEHKTRMFSLFLNKKNWKYFFLVPEEGADYRVKMVMLFVDFESGWGAKYREYGNEIPCWKMIDAVDKKFCTYSGDSI